MFKNIKCYWIEVRKYKGKYITLLARDTHNKMLGEYHYNVW